MSYKGQITEEFRKQADEVLLPLGLENITNSRHIRNRSIAYYDPIADCRYSLHETGYFRRSIRNFLFSNRWDCYQLNRINFEKQSYGEITYYSTQGRILISPENQLERLPSLVKKYRKRKS